MTKDIRQKTKDLDVIKLIDEEVTALQIPLDNLATPVQVLHAPRDIGGKLDHHLVPMG
jgi:hypothetical protein